MLFTDKEKEYLIDLVRIYLKEGWFIHDPYEKEKRFARCTSCIEKLQALNDQSSFTIDEYSVMLAAIIFNGKKIYAYGLPKSSISDDLNKKLWFLSKKQTVKDFISDLNSNSSAAKGYTILGEELKIAARNGGLKKYELSDSELETLYTYLGILPDLTDDNV